MWAKGAEEALDGQLLPGNPIGGIKQWYEQSVEYLNGVISLVRGDLTKLMRGSLVALITIDVHNCDIIKYFINDNTDSKKDFNWQMRIRYYWDDLIGNVGNCRIQQVNAEFIFAHEDLGASFRLVITPLSDRCYMTLTGALQQQLGGAPIGPATTGKTETTKDLARALGKCCVVFNCGDNLDYKFMGKFLKGLAQCGAWACFHEFNRINVEVLSVVAQQIITGVPFKLLCDLRQRNWSLKGDPHSWRVYYNEPRIRRLPRCHLLQRPLVWLCFVCSE